jgi:hypothetical protein
LWAVLRFHDAGSGTWGWEAYRSGNNGASWAATDSYLTSSTVDELDVAPVGDYVYVAYRLGGTSARIARYVDPPGTLDPAYGHVQMVGSDNLGHLALISNQDAGNNRLHLLVGDLLTLRWWLTDDDGGVGTLPWVPVPHGASPLANGSPLAAAVQMYASPFPVVVAYYTGAAFLAVLHWSPDHGSVESTFPWDGQMGAIAVAGAFEETYVVSPFTSASSGAGLRLRWSNNDGSSWTTESYATPDVGEMDVNPRLFVQWEDGFAGLAHRHSAADGSSSALHFSTRDRYFNVSEWVGPNRFDVPTSEGTDWLGFDVRQLPFGPTPNGALWVSNDPEPGAVYFEWILPWLSVDDFESGGTDAWSAVLP